MSGHAPGRLNVLDVLDTNFRMTRSGRAFSPWDSEAITSPAFDIASAVLQAVDVAADEGLAEPDATDDEATDDIDLDIDLPQEDPSTPDAFNVPDASNAFINASTSATTAPTSRKARAKRGSKLCRASARQSASVKRHIDLLPPSRRPQHIKKASPAVKTRFDIMKERVAATGWIGLRDEGKSKQEEAVGFEEAGWTHAARILRSQPKVACKARPILDAAGRVFALSGGHPDDPNWMRDVHDPAVAAMDAARAQCKVSEARTYHWRGNFPPLTAGDSYGGGQTQPGALVNGVINAAVLCALVSNVVFIRLAGFATGLFTNWSPKLYEYYATRMRRFYRRYTHFHQPFLNSIWSACTFNLGPQTCCLGHRDFGNLAFGWCAITALGDYDYTKGGHLILWDCKLILEFPPGTTLFIPSAALFHSNIPIGIGECRHSFTQYTAGGFSDGLSMGLSRRRSILLVYHPKNAYGSGRRHGRDGRAVPAYSVL
ncbi:hypothetical protein B0H16DRAFT_1727129 [Mycena metata]|uniref:Uncharacterized protein n=1 Tax=Mycena metata TaxID=1033252 RepID=A0AAD7IJZ8_9AGAR|nr:hypothetical protein B0H16DRAFT_1727129 [Mycena metata]